MVQTFSLLKVPKRARFCFLKKCAFSSGEEVYSKIRELKDESFVREDFCKECWKNHVEKDKATIYWKSKVERAANHKSLKGSAGIYEKFCQLLEQEGEYSVELFFLATYLQRARLLALREEQNQNKDRYYLYEYVSEERFFRIKVVDLSLVDQRKLLSLLA